MRLAFFGTGYVGLVTGTCFAELGNDVICVDVDAEKITALRNKIVPIYEPGLRDMIERNYSRLSFTTDAKSAVNSSDIIFIAVGTPPQDNGEADLSYIYAAAKTIAKHAQAPKVVVIKSTVPVGTAAAVKRILNDSSHKFDVVSNPEFLREGQAIYDFMHPDKIVLGGDSLEVMHSLYKPLERPNQHILKTNNENAELIKYANNSFLATKISFMNELSHLCECIGADIKVIGHAIGLDNRIGPRFLQAGAGYGGSCFPKDIVALISTMKKHDAPSLLLESVHKVNELQKKSLIVRLKKLMPELKGKRIALWGLAFKPKTDDIREAPSLVLIEDLRIEGAEICAFDPQAMKAVEKIHPDIAFAGTPYSALKDADALVVLTEWDEFRQLDRERMKSLMKSPVVFDARNIFNPEEMKQAGFLYKGIGR